MQLERSTSAQEIVNALGELIHKLRAPQNRELSRALAVWVRRLALRRFGPLPAEVSAQINAASAQQIEA